MDNTHGGKREGSGRPPAKPKDRKIKIWFSVKASKEKQARILIEPIITKLNA
jgi:hypothetical protein